ncbi:PHP domain-containing protein [Prosthecobacter sp. SYSU 5D2]|uniref:PHP domain-containing protein n=1 Tax=Prosthecobacter sp. SYSU 5D2 TaxID=3134134 RepID=UPI0031FE62CB
MSLSQPSPSQRVRAELHCHTIASSDGMITPDGLLKAAALQKLDIIAITDHDTTGGAVEFQKWFRKKNSATQILIGEERTLSNGCHLIGLFLHGDIVSQDAQDVMDEIHAQGGLVLVPHPYRLKDGLLGPRGLDLAQMTAADAYEIHNAKGSHADNLLARQLHEQLAPPFFGGSDAHYEADVGQCVNEIVATATAEETVRAMLRRQTPFRILSRPQSATTAERRYAPGYYAVKRFLAVPRPLLPLAKQAYRLYWNARHGSSPHALAELVTHPAVHA